MPGKSLPTHLSPSATHYTVPEVATNSLQEEMEDIYCE